jgi:hypothetical protein
VAPANRLESLDQLIADVGGGGDVGKQSGGSCNLLIEHLRSARTSFLGSMPAEYKSSLQEAKESAACISDKNTLSEVRKRLQTLIGD